MENIKKIPNFSYVISNGSRNLGNYVLIDGEIIHEIEDIYDFYRALGYTDEMQKAGIEPEVYRWERYTKDGAVASPLCLQDCIIEYLCYHSEKFKQQYACDIDNWIGTCTPENYRNIELCNRCRIRPGTK